MSRVSTSAAARRTANTRSLAAFGDPASNYVAGHAYRTVHEGKGPTVFTVGYEKRDGEGLVGALRDAGVEVLIDVRERPFSRVPDFRRGPLDAACASSGLEYQSWERLGSTDSQRDQLRASGDFVAFRRRFRDLVVRGRVEELDELASLAKRKCIAMLCYERCHEECHRSILAELLHNAIDANVVAIC